jgi:hypothetical protein
LSGGHHKADGADRRRGAAPVPREILRSAEGAGSYSTAPIPSKEPTPNSLLNKVLASTLSVKFLLFHLSSQHPLPSQGLAPNRVRVLDSTHPITQVVMAMTMTIVIVIVLVSVLLLNINTNNGNDIITIAIIMIMATSMYNTCARTINNTISSTISIIIILKINMTGINSLTITINITSAMIMTMTMIMNIIMT